MVAMQRSGRRGLVWLVSLAVGLLGSAVVIPQPAAAVGQVWYVDDDGACTIDCDGSSAKPYKTIDEAADQAVADDVVEIRSGTYRETVTPANSGTSGQPITFQPASGATVTISGVDELTGSWTACDATECDGLATDPSNVYYTTMAWDATDIGLQPDTDPDLLLTETVKANQVFVNGEMVPEARWPNLPGDGSGHFDFSRPPKAFCDTGTSSGTPNGNGYTTQTIASPDLDNNAKVDAFVHLNAGGIYWFGSGERILSVGTDELTATYTTFTGEVDSPGGLGCAFWLSPGTTSSEADMAKADALSFLDSPGEWVNHGDTLYLYKPVGTGPPSGVEARPATYRHAFDLSDRSYITILGHNPDETGQLTLFGAGIQTSAGVQASGTCTTGWTTEPTHHVVIDGIDARYLDHYTDMFRNGVLFGGNSYPLAREEGIVLRGYLNMIQNSRIGWTAGIGVRLKGCDNSITNNVIHDVGYSSLDAPAVYADHSDGVAFNNGTIEYNTMYNSAAPMIIALDPLRNGRIAHNELYNSSLQVNDHGLIKLGRDGDNTEIAYNYIHGAHSLPGSGSSPPGIAWDSGDCDVDTSGPHIVHHNVVADVGGGVGINQRPIGLGLYNNSFGSVGGESFGFSDAVCGDGWTEGGNVLRNNIFFNAQVVGLPTDGTSSGGVTVSNNVRYPTNPLFETDSFGLQAGSPAVNAGFTVSPYTDDAVGDPDIGACERGATAWEAGANVFGASRIAPCASTGGTACSGGVVGNCGFETGLLSPWSFPTGSGSIVSPGANGSSYAVELSGVGTYVEQTVSVQPSTTYTVSGVAKITGDGSVVIGAYSFGGVPDESNSDPITSSTYTEEMADFTTGASATTAKIYCWIISGSGSPTATCDDVKLTEGGGGSPGGSLENGDFESAILSPWENGSASYPAVVQSGEGRDASYGLMVPSGAAGPEPTWAVQTITGLSNGTYTFSCYLRVATSGDTVEVGAEGYGGAYVADPTSSTAWEQNSVQVNVTNGQINVIVYRSDSYGSGDAYADDCTLT